MTTIGDRGENAFVFRLNECIYTTWIGISLNDVRCHDVRFRSVITTISGTTHCATGGELGPWARRAIDDRLAATMHEQCAAVDGGPACRHRGLDLRARVRANSWRQGQGVPVSERGAPYLVASGLIVAAVASPPLAGRLRHRWRKSAVAAATRTAASR